MKQERILFLYTSAESGHKECADSVRMGFKSFYPSSVQTVGIDAINYLYPFLGNLVAKTYLEILRYTPQIWNFLYDNPKINEITKELRQLFSFFNSSKLKLLLDEYDPTMFVCTHAIPCSVIAEQKRRGNCRLPLVAIITDYAVHSYWVDPEVNLYIVANHESQKSLTAKGVPKEKIKVCGIPISLEFNRKMNRHTARMKLGLDVQKPVILIMGGIRGFGPIEEITRELVLLQPVPQILVLTGINRDLEKKLNCYSKNENIQIFGYTSMVSILMDAADLLITKPGGMTTSEALVKELPMILVNPIPGQEVRNARYLLKHHAAVQVKNLREIRETVKQFFCHPETLKSLSENAKKISTPFAAKDAQNAIISLAHLKEHKSIEQFLGFNNKYGDPNIPEKTSILESISS